MLYWVSAFSDYSVWIDAMVQNNVGLRHTIEVAWNVMAVFPL